MSEGQRVLVPKDGNPIEIRSPYTKISLRQFSPEDAEEIFALIDRNREHLSQFGDDTAEKYKTLESVQESIINPKNPKRLRFAVRNGEGIVVGSINLTPDEDNPKRGEIGYYLGSEYQKKGFMNQAIKLLTEQALYVLRYETVYGDVHKENTASSKALISAGYEQGEVIGDNIRYSIQKPRPFRF